MLFDSAGDYVLTSGDKHVRVFHNVTGRRTALVSARQKLTAAGLSAATKERLQELISINEKFLNTLKEPLSIKAKWQEDNLFHNTFNLKGVGVKFYVCFFLNCVTANFACMLF